MTDLQTVECLGGTKQKRGTGLLGFTNRLILSVIVSEVVDVSLGFDVCVSGVHEGIVL